MLDGSGVLDLDAVVRIVSLCTYLCVVAGGKKRRAVPTEAQRETGTYREKLSQYITVDRYTSPFVMLSRVNRKLREITRDVVARETAYVTLYADGACSWTGAVDLTAVQWFRDRAIRLCTILGGAVRLSAETVKCVNYGLLQMCEVDRRGVAMVYWPWELYSHLDYIEGPIFGAADVTGICHAFPSFTYSWRREVDPTDESGFIEHVILADFVFLPSDVAALRTPGVRVESATHSRWVTRLLETASGVVPIQAELRCCFELKAKVGLYGENIVFWTCIVWWGRRAPHLPHRVPMREPRYPDMPGADVDISEKAKLLAIVGDSHWGGIMGPTGERQARAANGGVVGLHGTTRKYDAVRHRKWMQQQVNDGCGIRFTAMVGVCQMMTHERTAFDETDDEDSSFELSASTESESDDDVLGNETHDDEADLDASD